MKSWKDENPMKIGIKKLHKNNNVLIEGQKERLG